MRLPLNQVGSLNKINKALSRFEQEYERRIYFDNAATTQRPVQVLNAGPSANTTIA